MHVQQLAILTAGSITQKLDACVRTCTSQIDCVRIITQSHVSTTRTGQAFLNRRILCIEIIN